jgi:hypothetical protein
VRLAGAGDGEPPTNLEINVTQGSTDRKLPDDLFILKLPNCSVEFTRQQFKDFSDRVLQASGDNDGNILIVINVEE